MRKSDVTTDMQTAAHSAMAAHGAMRAADRVALLGIPTQEMTPTVRLVISALMEKLDDTTAELGRTKDALAEMERLVDVDCVVPIANRRAFMRRLNWALSMFERYGYACSVLYFDVNDFKAINDSYGHAAGDLAIQHVAQVLSSSIRAGDFLARIGGDEFAIIMHHADENSARQRGAAIVNKLESTPFQFNSRNIMVNAACGVYSVRHGDNAETALSGADTAMYVDKRRFKMAVARA